MIVKSNSTNITKMSNLNQVEIQGFIEILDKFIKKKKEKKKELKLKNAANLI